MYVSMYGLGLYKKGIAERGVVTTSSSHLMKSADQRQDTSIEKGSTKFHSGNSRSRQHRTIGSS